jgi:hypothetical protein
MCANVCFPPIADTRQSGHKRSMRHAAIALLVLFAIAFDLFALWALWFTLAWGGAALPKGTEWIGLAAFVFSPIFVTG